jgi:hypothetical protein
MFSPLTLQSKMTSEEQQNGDCLEKSIKGDIVAVGHRSENDEIDFLLQYTMSTERNLSLITHLLSRVIEVGKISNM